MDGEKRKVGEELKERALKLTEALYRTTELFSDAEPLKWSLRETALEVLNETSAISSTSGIVNYKEIEEAKKLINGLFIKLELAASGTLISKMNFEVLEREYLVLKNELAGKMGELSISDMFLLDKPIMDTKLSDKSDKVEEPLKTSNETKPFVKPVEVSVLNGRREAIVTALKNKGASSVGDLVGLFNGTVGAKTIQRELVALVTSGLIRQEGDKRWRRYFI